MEMQSYSRGLLSTWNYIPEFRILFDAGDGVSTVLGRKGGAIDVVAITHEHLDHISGLTAFINLRHRMAPEQQLLLLLPPKFHTGYSFWDKVRITMGFAPKRKTRFDHTLGMLGEATLAKVTVMYVSPGMEIPIGGKKMIKVVKTRHTFNSVGYLIQETRTKLKEEFIGKTGPELKEIKANGEEISKKGYHTLLAYTGDTPQLNAEEIEVFSKADVLITEATFLKEEEGVDHTKQNHALLNEAIEIGMKAKPKTLVLQHFSPRYTDGEIMEVVEELNYPGEMEIILGRKQTKIIA